MIEVYQDAKGEWRWKVIAENSKIVADSAEGYIERKDCVDGLNVALRIMIESATLKIESTLEI